MKCPICNNETKYVFSETVLNKYNADYRSCNFCGYLYIDSPHWLDEAYSNAIASSDTGLVLRNVSTAKKVASILYWGLGERGSGTYVDIAGGYGMLTRLMRDYGFNFYWEDKYCDNILANGFEFSNMNVSCTAITAFEVLEHLTDPLAFISDSVARTKANVVIVSTELYHNTVPKPCDWNYYSFGTGQHIGFFNRNTLDVLGKRLGMNVATANGIHLFSKRVFNEHYLSILTGKIAPHLASIWAPRKLGSKTRTDSEMILCDHTQ